MRSFTRWIIALCATPLGVVVLAALDSTLFFSLPFGIDAVVVLLSARLGELGWTVPLLATGGSLAGAWLTFWMGRKIGEKGLDEYVEKKRLNTARKKIENGGAVALAVLDLIPPPFPFTAFLLAAGALDVDARLFFVTLTVARIIRFGVEAALAVIYGQRILGWMESDLFHGVVAVFTFLAFALTALSMIKLIRSTRTSGKQTERRAPA